MAFHCLNCNGSVVFDIATQKMRCQHCDSEFDPQDYAIQRTDSGVAQGAGESWFDDGEQTSGMTRYTCRSCGAELESTEDSMIGFCPYCGGQSMVAEATEAHMVERIIPFKISKEECISRYRQYTSHVRYLPKELRDADYISKFTGIYMPYYEYDARFGQFCLKGSKTVEHNSRYDVEQFYDIRGEVQGDYERGVVFDGSRYLDDEISARTLPFDSEQEKPFVPAYLAGFYADTSTVDPEVYYADAAEQASNQMVDSLCKSVHEDTGITMKDTSTISTDITGHHSTLFPMWFLTWRKDDRVAYAVINGESGKVVSDLPLDLKSFGLGCIAFSAVVFVLLELLVQPTPLVTSFISLFAALCMAMGIRSGAKRQYEREQHTYDKGWETEGAEAASPAKKRAGLSDSIKDVLAVGLLVFGAMVVALVVGDLSSSFLTGLLRFVLPAVTLAESIYVLVRVLGWKKHLAKSDPVVAAAILLVTVVLNSVIILINPVDDLWYYAGDALCIVGLLVASVGMVRAYNLATTRPLPKLFDREEVQ